MDLKTRYVTRARNSQESRRSCCDESEVEMPEPRVACRFYGSTNLESIEFKVSMVCLVTRCVSRRRDGS